MTFASDVSLRRKRFKKWKKWVENQSAKGMRKVRQKIFDQFFWDSTHHYCISRKQKDLICDFIIIFSIVLDFICTYCFFSRSLLRAAQGPDNRVLPMTFEIQDQSVIRSSSGMPDCLLDEDQMSIIIREMPLGETESSIFPFIPSRFHQIAGHIPYTFIILLH